MKFNVGDRVVVCVEPVDGEIGTVANVRESGWGTKQVLDVELDDGALIEVSNTALEPLE